MVFQYSIEVFFTEKLFFVLNFAELGVQVRYGVFVMEKVKNPISNASSTWKSVLGQTYDGKCEKSDYSYTNTKTKHNTGGLCINGSLFSTDSKFWQ